MMKYLILLLPVLFFSTCDSRSSCFNLTGEDATLTIDVNHNLEGGILNYGDTLELSISFPEEMLNEKSSSLFDITPHEPSFALHLQDRAFDGYFDWSPKYLESAKDQFMYNILEGEELNLNFYFLNDVSEAINIRPKLSQGQYSLKIQFYASALGEYLIYWNYLHRDFLALDGEDENDLAFCKDLIKVKINNPGNTNLSLASDNQSLQENQDFVKEFGLFLFNVGN